MIGFKKCHHKFSYLYKMNDQAFLKGGYIKDVSL